jgi:Rrf2 family iron-sulfur cluster assembly transcriptional regulator
MSDTQTFVRSPDSKERWDLHFRAGEAPRRRRPTGGSNERGSPSRYSDEAPASTVGSTGAHCLCSGAMRLSHQVQYAICGIFDLAYNGRGEPVQIRVISERQAIPSRYLEQIFQKLRRAGLVSSKRGPGGGYTLSRAAARITLREVVEAVQGPIADALAMKPADSEAAASFRPDFLWTVLADRFGGALDDITLEQLCGAATRAEVERAAADPPMYFI